MCRNKSQVRKLHVAELREFSDPLLIESGGGGGDAKTLNFFEDFFGFRNVCQLCCAKVLGDDFFLGVTTGY